MSEYKRKTKCISAWVGSAEWEAFSAMATRSNVSNGDMLRALIVDALYEEGYFVGPIRQEGSTTAEQAREASGSSQ